MELNLSVIIDGFSGYKPVVCKTSDTKAKIRGFHYYSPEFAETDPGYMYVTAGKAFGKNCPKHIIICGNMPKGVPEKADTLVQIPGNIPIKEVIQTGNAVIASYEAWYNSLLMAVINRKSIDDFLNVAARKLANPIVVFNNNLCAMSSAGSITGPVKGTNWEIVGIPGFVLDNFYTPQELRKISSHIAQKSEQILSVNPKNDPAHSSLGILIWIEGKLYGGIGTVDMNEPFTDGQKETFATVAKILKLYFQNHSIYMQIAGDKTNWLNSLLDGAGISADIITNYLYRYQWKLDDRFSIVTISSPGDLNIPVISLFDIKQINDLFPDALVSVRDENIVIIFRHTDKKQLHGKKKQLLEQFLNKDISLRCGASMVFNNFMRLRYYYTQSKFAAAQCRPPETPAICFYEDYQTDHVLHALSLGADPRCFCHPGILALWESGGELQRNLVHCLYYYFINGKNISATAEAIHIHRNTLIYRLGKAEEILDIDLKHPSARQEFMYIISCLIVQRL